MNISLFTLIPYFLIFISGCFIGSFLKLVSDRIVNGETILFGRSKCDHCKKPLSPLSMIPVISYVFQRGRCSKCKKKFSILYPISELLTGTLFLASAIYLNIFQNFNFYALIYFIFLLIVLSLYVIMTFSDLSYYIIPDKIVYLATFIVFIFLTASLFFNMYTFYQSLSSNPLGKYLIQAGYLKSEYLDLLISYFSTIISAFAVALFFFSLIVVTKGKGMGGGDVKLAFLIGLFNGFPYNIIAIFLGFIFGSVISLILIALKIKTLKDIIPFGPFLMLGSVVALFLGTFIFKWYLNLM